MCSTDIIIFENYIIQTITLMLNTKENSDEPPPIPSPKKTIDNKYELLEPISEKQTSSVYKVSHIKTNALYAAKIQPPNPHYPQLLFEAKLLHRLNLSPNSQEKGILRLHYAATLNSHVVTVTDLLGPSLQSILHTCEGKKFSLKTVLMIFDQLVDTVEFLHSSNFIHRFINPSSICVGLNQNKGRIYLVNFGKAKRYTQKDGSHIPDKQGKGFLGNETFASIHSHLGIEQGRRDDLESVAYMLIYFLKGTLTWEGLQPTRNIPRDDRIKDRKLATSSQHLCAGLPQEFEKFLKEVKQIEPDYGKYKEMFRNLFEKSSFEWDGQYDWTKAEGNQEISPREKEKRRDSE